MKLKKKNFKNGSAVITSLLVMLFVIVVMFSIIGIYINKVYSIKNLNDYYDKKIVEQLTKNISNTE
ncbi:hypothetical protein HMPREF1983_01182 [Gemella bergeri ATCC 700627]|uniref:Uncharacterized protein n=2 Tax=Gemella bergeri TaxID=84136 RepID=U2Q376_9BACL|nr:hypothetical protein HMPREF1983_01182 [Gemella bergeri ATCC 700627]